LLNVGGFVTAAQRSATSQDETWFLYSAFVGAVEMFVVGVLIEDRKSVTKTDAAN
jgi:hypothetical protein